MVDVALPHLGVAHLGALELGTRIGQHGRAQIDAEAAPIAIAQQFEHAPGPRAEIDQQPERARPERRRHRGLHLGLRNM